MKQQCKLTERDDIEEDGTDIYKKLSERKNCCRCNHNANKTRHN